MINIRETAIIPYNKTSNVIRIKDKYHLYAPIAGFNNVGLAAFTSRDFNIESGKVELKVNLVELYDTCNTTFTEQNQRLTSLEDHANNRTNPHNVTKGQVGLNNVDNEKQIPMSYLDDDEYLGGENASDKKVPTQKAVKEFVGDITKDAQSDWTEENVLKTSYIKNKPTAVSDFTNDLDYQTKTEVDTTIANHNTDTEAHSTEFGAKEDKSQKGQPNGYASLNASGVVPHSQIDPSYRVMKVVQDIVARDALTEPEGTRVHVIDASADETVESGWAEYLKTSTGWTKTAEKESIDVILKAENVESPLYVGDSYVGTRISDLDSQRKFNVTTKDYLNQYYSINALKKLQARKSFTRLMSEELFAGGNLFPFTHIVYDPKYFEISIDAYWGKYNIKKIKDNPPYYPYIDFADPKIFPHRDTVSGFIHVDGPGFPLRTSCSVVEEMSYTDLMYVEGSPNLFTQIHLRDPYHTYVPYNAARIRITVNELNENYEIAFVYKETDPSDVYSSFGRGAYIDEQYMYERFDNITNLRIRNGEMQYKIKGQAEYTSLSTSPIQKLPLDEYGDIQDFPYDVPIGSLVLRDEGNDKTLYQFRGNEHHEDFTSNAQNMPIFNKSNIANDWALTSFDYYATLGDVPSGLRLGKVVNVGGTLYIQGDSSLDMFEFLAPSELEFPYRESATNRINLSTVDDRNIKIKCKLVIGGDSIIAEVTLQYIPDLLMWIASEGGERYYYEDTGAEIPDMSVPIIYAHGATLDPDKLISFFLAMMEADIDTIMANFPFTTGYAVDVFVVMSSEVTDIVLLDIVAEEGWKNLSSNFSKVAFSGDYNDLINKPKPTTNVVEFVGENQLFEPYDVENIGNWVDILGDGRDFLCVQNNVTPIPDDYDGPVILSLKVNGIMTEGIMTKQEVEPGLNIHIWEQGDDQIFPHFQVMFINNKEVSVDPENPENPFIWTEAIGKSSAIVFNKGLYDSFEFISVGKEVSTQSNNMTQISFASTDFANGEITFTPAQTGLSSSLANVIIERQVSGGYASTANSVVKLSDGTVKITNINEPFTGRIIIINGGA